MKEMKKILEGVYSNLNLRQKVVPLFISNPGMGKTQVIEAFAKEKGVRLIEIISSQISPWEVSGMAIPDKTSRTMTYYDFDRLNDLKDGDILFFDEILSAATQILSACLTLIESRRTISGKLLPKIMIVAAANPQNQAPLPPAVKERFVWYYLNFDKDSWKEHMIDYLLTDGIFEQLSVLIKNESFNSSEKNYFTPRSIVKAINMILDDVPTPYSKKLLPILNNNVINTSENNISLPNGKIWEKEQPISWLTLNKLMKNETTI